MVLQCKKMQEMHTVSSGSHDSPLLSLQTNHTKAHPRQLQPPRDAN
jgi:hypothetical protein